MLSGAACSRAAPSSSAPPPRASQSAPAGATTAYPWRLALGLPMPRVPADNPMSVEKVGLGRRLFYDTRLSGNGTFSCASCHQQSRAFTDGRAHALGSTGGLHPRSAMSLTNVAYNSSYGWADARVRTLEAQMAVPMFNEHPIEMGIKGNEAAIVTRFASSGADAALFAAAFPDDARPVSLDNAVKAIASFERTLTSAGSPFDRYLYRDERDALTPEAIRGMALFFSDRLRCGQCHSGFNLSGPSQHEADVAAPTFHNTGLYNVDGRGSYPSTDRGMFDVTHRPADMGAFRAPTLRNVAVTAPYMHDGSVPTLEAAVGHYASGGVDSPVKSPRIRPFRITAAESHDLIAFLNSLTDREFLTDPTLARP